MPEIDSYGYLPEIYDVVWDGYHFNVYNHLKGFFSDWIDGGEGKKLLDLGCGTGSFLLLMGEKGWNVTGIDSSESMIERARQKAKDRKVECKFIKEDIRNFRLQEKFHLITCNFDTINYVIEDSGLRDVLKRVKNHLKKGGFFVFDSITPFQCRTFTGEFREEHEDFELIMNPSYNSKKRIKTMKIVVNSAGKEFREIHSQRCYEIRELKEFLVEEGFSLEEIIKHETESEDKEKTGVTRVFFFCKK